MIDEKAKAILKRAFSVLNREQIENFRYHLRNETPVLCGRRTFISLEFVVDGYG